MIRAEHLRPSGAATWAVCSGYVAMRAAYPEAPEEADNEVREDGVACHWLAAEVWAGRFPAEGSLSPNGRVIDEEMFDAVDMYHGVLRSPASQDCEWYIERPVPCDVIYPGMSGTPDAWCYRPGWLRVADLKYGFRFVEVWENLQLIIYSAAIAHQLKLPPDTMVEMCIIQPRSNHRDGPVRTWTTKLANLNRFVQMLRAAAISAMEPNAPCTPNPGCTDCGGRHACVALQASAMSALEQSYAGMPLELTPAAVADELRRLVDAQKKMEARISGLQVQAESLLRNGTTLPGWTLAPTFARERWREGVENDVVTLGRYFGGVDLAKPQQPISPARARKLIPANVVAAYAHKPSTGVKLVKQDPFEARKKFQQPS